MLSALGNSGVAVPGNCGVAVLAGHADELLFQESVPATVRREVRLPAAKLRAVGALSVNYPGIRPSGWPHRSLTELTEIYDVTPDKATISRTTQMARISLQPGWLPGAEVFHAHR